MLIAQARENLLAFSHQLHGAEENIQFRLRNRCPFVLVEKINEIDYDETGRALSARSHISRSVDLKVDLKLLKSRIGTLWRTKM